MELIRAAQVREFSNSGVTSRQLLFPENSSSTRLTITRVTVKPGARNPPHRHPASEQVWIALRGHGSLHLEAGRTESFVEGDVVRFEDGDLHGFENTGSVDFEYLSVTSPPVNFWAAYERNWSGKGKSDAQLGAPADAPANGAPLTSVVGEQPSHQREGS